MTKRRRSLSACTASAALLLVACGGGGNAGGTSVPPTAAASTLPVETGPIAGGDTTPAGTGDTTAPTTAAAGGWTVDTSKCADPARAEQPITGTVKIGAAVPLSGGPAAAFGPVKDGVQLYLDMASEQGLLPGYTLTADIRDDQYDSTQTPGVIDGLIDGGTDVFAGI
ncbi:MAG: ABC transporter substrate-binding protein, partial [Ilumatobacteraceae bacterium]